jgi:mono/diheme cytochrome c family protein
MGLLWASNLTTGEGGIAGSYTDADWDRSIRHGVGPDGKPLMFMPAQEFWPLSDDDLAALIAYYRSKPPVDRTIPEPSPGPLARFLYLTGQLPLVPAELVDHEAERPAAPPVGPTAEYGAYLATGCVGCHGPNLSGGKIVGGDPNWPPAKNITPEEETGIGAWSHEDFVVAMREGIRPDGSEINPVMPIQATRHMTDVELEAIYRYLMSLEPRMFGNR